MRPRAATRPDEVSAPAGRSPARCATSTATARRSARLDPRPQQHGLELPAAAELVDERVEVAADGLGGAGLARDREERLGVARRGRVRGTSWRSVDALDAARCASCTIPVVDRRRRLFLMSRSATWTARSATSCRSSWRARRRSCAISAFAASTRRAASARAASTSRRCSSAASLSAVARMACASAWAAWIFAACSSRCRCGLGPRRLRFLERLLDGLGPLLHLGDERLVEELPAGSEQDEEVDQPG